jgi:hypothetical protein
MELQNLYFYQKISRNMSWEEKLKKESAAIITQIVKWISTNDAVDIRFDCLDDDQWSSVTMYQDDEKEFSIRLHLNNVFELHVGYYDEEDEFFEFTQLMSEEDKKLIPEVLKKLLKRVVDDEKDIRINGTFVTK